MVQVGKDITWQDSLILENEVSVLNNVLYADLTGVFLVVGCTLFISLVNCLSEIPTYGLQWFCTVTLSLITGSNNYILDFSVNLNQQISFALMFTVALGIKVPVFPFHLWLPEVHSETDTCGSVLLAGVLLKVGSYGLMRFTLTLFPVGYSYWSCFIFVVSLFGSYLGSINCLTIYDIKQIIAYSSITHMNLAVADLFTLNIYGLQGSLVTSLAHGLSSSGLFCSVGFI